jgi:hypothetical protein
MKRHGFAFATAAALGLAPAGAQTASETIDAHLVAGQEGSGFRFSWHTRRTLRRAAKRSDDISRTRLPANLERIKTAQGIDIAGNFRDTPGQARVLGELSTGTLWSSIRLSS